MVEYRFWNSRLPQVFAALAATVGAIAFGSALGWSSPAIPSLESIKPFYISAEIKPWIGSIPVLGAAISCPFAGLFSEKLGRKRTIMTMSFPFIAGWLILAFGDSSLMLLIGRFITGFCGGTFSVTIPMYIAEISDSRIRGRLGGCFQLMLNIGILFAYVVGSSVDWFWLSLSCSVLPVILAILMIFMPESPHYLLRRGKVSEASRRLCWLRSAGLSVNVDHELRQIHASIEESRNSKVKCVDLLSPHIWKPTGICMSLMFFQQLSGINAVIFYAETIFADTGSQMDASTSAIIVALVAVGATAVSSSLIDKAGRKILLIVSETFMTISLILLGIYFYIKSFGSEYADVIDWLPIVGLSIFIVAFSLGMGPIPWVIMGEFLPQNVKGVTSAMTAMLSWLLAFMITSFFDQFQDMVGAAWSWWIFSMFSGVGLIFVIFLVPETRGKSLDEIQQVFA